MYRLLRPAGQPSSLKRPRKIMFMIMAGKPVDSMIDQLIPLLDQGDILIDGGNSYFGDTRRRYEYCQKQGIHFYGMGTGRRNRCRRGRPSLPGGVKTRIRKSSPTLVNHCSQRPVMASPAIPISQREEPALCPNGHNGIGSLRI